MSPIVATRPTPGTPRPYDFPPFERTHLANGLSVIAVHIPGRELISATLLLRNGAAGEPAEHAGATVMAARALSEGTERYDAIALTEATERLGASLHAEAGWDALSAGVDVPVSRLGAALELLAEMAGRPTFPESEVERLRDERLNDLLQARADPRRRVEEAFAATIFSAASPYHRPAGGRRETVHGLDPAALRAAYRRGFDPAEMTLIVGGDLVGIDIPALSGDLFGGWSAAAEAAPSDPPIADPALSERFVRVVHRPGAVQTEIRIGHIGMARRIPDFHAVSVMATILGGLFNSRLNMKLREERGYTYGSGASFDLRRAPGPFAARAAVNTEVTVPAIVDMLGELSRMRDTRVRDGELRAARDFLIGVFPLRFETPGPVVGALAGIVTHDLPDDELMRYRPSIEAVTVDDVQRAAVEHVLPDRAAIVLVGDADAFAAELEAAGVGRVIVEREGMAPTDDSSPPDAGAGPIEGAPEEDRADID